MKPNWKRATAIVALCLLTTLAGCKLSVRGGVTPILPALPADLAEPCPDPGVRAGKPALGELARNRQARGECSRKQQGTVDFYNDLRGRVGSAPPAPIDIRPGQ